MWDTISSVGVLEPKCIVFAKYIALFLVNSTKTSINSIDQANVVIESM